MENEQIKRYLITRVVRNMQIITTVRYHFLHIKLLTVKKIKTVTYSVGRMLIASLWALICQNLLNLRHYDLCLWKPILRFIP